MMIFDDIEKSLKKTIVPTSRRTKNAPSIAIFVGMCRNFFLTPLGRERGFGGKRGSGADENGIKKKMKIKERQESIWNN